MKNITIALFATAGGLVFAQSAPVPVIAAGTAKGPAVVKVFNKNQTTQLLGTMMPYGFSSHGVNVAVGDVNRDGFDEVITGPTGGPSIVKVLTQNGTVVRSFDAYPGFTGGVFVATGDVNGDGFFDIVVGAGPGAAPHVKVFNGNTGALLASFYAYPPTFTGGVSVAAGDVDGDGRADIITGAGPGAPGGHVKVFDGATSQEVASYLAYDAAFVGGVRVASADYDGDGAADIITGAGPGGGPHVRVFDGETDGLLASFFAFDTQYNGGVNVAGPLMAAQLNPSTTPQIRIFSNGMTTNFTPFPGYVGGLTMAATWGSMPRLLRTPVSR